MPTLPYDVAVTVLSGIGLWIGIAYFFWALVHMHENRLAFWIVRIVVWIAGLGVGFLIAWAIHSLIAGGVQ